MSSPAEYYKSLPPISKAYGTLCFFTTVLVQLQILHPLFLYLDYPLVFKKFEIWRLLTSFFFLAPFSMKFGIRLLMIARYGVMLEKGAFDKRTADFLWMMIFGASFYLPWAMLLLDVIFGSSLMPGLLGIMVGHLYYFFAVLHPLATGKSYLKTPKWVRHKIVARFRIGMQANSPVRPPANGNSGSGVFRGRSYRLNQ
nr:derlin1-1 [Zea mays]